MLSCEPPARPSRTSSSHILLIAQPPFAVLSDLVQLEFDERIRFLRDRIKACQSLVMRETLKKMKRVLRRLGHIDASNVVLTKGRVACEVNTADELLVTELIFNGVFNDLSPAQTVCCFALSRCRELRSVWPQRLRREHRPSEPVLRAGDVDASPAVWTTRMLSHHTEYAGCVAFLSRVD